ncbi:MAG: hypothetical protein ACTSWE_15660 [Promethearchaeota archaeon]
MPKLNPEEYQKILSGLELENIRLKKISVELFDEYINQKMTVKIKDKALFEKKSSNLIKIFNDYTISVKAEDMDREGLKFQIRYELTFSSKNEFTKDFFDIYKKISLPINVWPFVRECVNSITARMNIPPLTLPLIKRMT